MKKKIQALMPFKLIPSEELQMRRIQNAETKCKEAKDDKWKSFWFDVFSKLCKKYKKMEYFRKVIH